MVSKLRWRLFHATNNIVCKRKLLAPGEKYWKKLCRAHLEAQEEEVVYGIPDDIWKTLLSRSAVALRLILGEKEDNWMGGKKFTNKILSSTKCMQTSQADWGLFVGYPFSADSNSTLGAVWIDAQNINTRVNRDCCEPRSGNKRSSQVRSGANIVYRRKAKAKGANAWFSRWNSRVSRIFLGRLFHKTYSSGSYIRDPSLVVQ